VALKPADLIQAIKKPAQWPMTRRLGCRLASPPREQDSYAREFYTTVKTAYTLA